MSDQKDLSTLLAELDAAVAKMTPGPWSVEIDEYDTDEHNISIPEIRRTLHDSEWADVKELPRDTANAHGIVALVNAYPRLREAIEQLQQDLSKVPLPRKSPDNVEAWAQKLAEDTGNADD